MTPSLCRRTLCDMTQPVFTARDLELHADQRVTLNATWKEYEVLLAMRGDSARPRLTYLEGVLELANPGRDHELDKTMLARLLEAYTEELDIDLVGMGSSTLEDRAKERGAERARARERGQARAPNDTAPSQMNVTRLASSATTCLLLWRST